MCVCVSFTVLFCFVILCEAAVFESVGGFWGVEVKAVGCGTVVSVVTVVSETGTDWFSWLRAGNMRGINGPIEAITAMTVAVNAGGRGGGHVDWLNTSGHSCTTKA